MNEILERIDIFIILNDVLLFWIYTFNQALKREQ